MGQPNTPFNPNLTPGPLQTRWINLLQSGTLKQTTNRLIGRDALDVRYCCLGVAEVLVLEREVCGTDFVQAHGDSKGGIVGVTGCMSEYDAELLGLRSSHGNMLVSNNHVARDMTHRLADLIEGIPHVVDRLPLIIKEQSSPSLAFFNDSGVDFYAIGFILEKFAPLFFKESL